MDKAQLLELLDVGPVIASVKDEAGLSAALKSDVGVIFLLFGDVLNIGEMVGRAHAAGKAVFVHLDLVDGLAAREVSVDFIARNTAADGVLSTKASLTRRAKAVSYTHLVVRDIYLKAGFQIVKTLYNHGTPSMLLYELEL